MRPDTFGDPAGTLGRDPTENRVGAFLTGDPADTARKIRPVLRRPGLYEVVYLLKNLAPSVVIEGLPESADCRDRESWCFLSRDRNLRRELGWRTGPGWRQRRNARAAFWR